MIIYLDNFHGVARYTRVCSVLQTYNKSISYTYYGESEYFFETEIMMMLIRIVRIRNRSF